MTSNGSTPVVIFGAGGLAREVAWVLNMPGTMLQSAKNKHSPTIHVLGHLDDREELHGTEVNGRTILGGAAWLVDRPGHAVVVAVGNPAARRKVVERLRATGAEFPTILASATVLGDEVEFGEGVITLPGVVITCNVHIGDFVLLNPHVNVSHDCRIGDYCSLGPGVSLAGNVHVGSLTDIGTNASAIPGARIGSEVVIGAGACVVHDVPDGVTAVGVPAKVISKHARNQEF